MNAFEYKSQLERTNQALGLENQRLRAIFPRVLAALQSGGCSPECSLEFLEMIPGEVQKVREGWERREAVLEREARKAVAELNERLHERTQGFLRVCARERKERAEWREGRREGRAEALGLLVRVNPEDIDDYIKSRALADTGDYVSYWDVAKLQELLRVEHVWAPLEELESGWWEHCAEVMRLEEKVLSLQFAKDQTQTRWTDSGTTEMAAAWGGFTGFRGPITVGPAEPEELTAGELWDRLVGEQRMDEVWEAILKSEDEAVMDSMGYPEQMFTFGLTRRHTATRPEGYSYLYMCVNGRETAAQWISRETFDQAWGLKFRRVESGKEGC